MVDAAISLPPLLVFADDWGRHPSSCQHLVRRLQGVFTIVWANTIGTRRVKANAFTLRRGAEKLRNWRRGLNRVSEQMWVVDLPMLPAGSSRLSRSVNQRLVGRRLSSVFDRLGLAPPIVLTTLPNVPQWIGDFERRSLIYYCTDDYSFWPGAERETMQRAEAELARGADRVIAISQALVSRLSSHAPCEYLPHGVDVAHFAAASKQGAVPEEVAALNGRKIGFFGLIYEKLDFRLLASVAAALPDDTLVMIGPVDVCPDEFRKLPNVVFLGRKPYAELPRWLSGLDVLLLPYVDDEMIRQSSPLKLRECLATGKPTVSVDVPEARLMQPHVRIGADVGEFVRHVRESLDEPLDSAARVARQAAVANDDWDSRAAQLKTLLQQVALQ